MDSICCVSDFDYAQKPLLLFRKQLSAHYMSP